MESPTRTEVNVKEVFQEISESISRHGYFPQSQDMVALRECVLELAKWPALELTTGGIGGWLLGSVLGRRVPAACIGMFICYGQVDRRPAEDFCLHRIMALPTPLGAEATAIVRGFSARQVPSHIALPSLLSQAAQTKQICLSRQPWPQLCKSNFLRAMPMLFVVKMTQFGRPQTLLTCAHQTQPASSPARQQQTQSCRLRIDEGKGRKRTGRERRLGNRSIKANCSLTWIMMTSSVNLQDSVGRSGRAATV